MATRVQRTMAGCLAGLMLCGAISAVSSHDTTLNDIVAPSVAQAKTHSSTSTVKNGQFRMSYTDLVDNLNTAFNSDDLLELASLEAVANTRGSDLMIEIKSGKETVGFGLLYDEDNNILDTSKASRGFNDFTLYFPMENEDTVAYVTAAQFAAFKATSPNMSSSKLSELVNTLDNSVEVISDSPTNPIMGGGVRYNGIEYKLFLMSDTWMITIEVGQ